MTHQELLETHGGASPCTGELKQLGSYRPPSPPEQPIRLYVFRCRECGHWLERNSATQRVRRIFPAPGSAVKTP